MIAVVQRVKHSRVNIGKKRISEIKRGLLVFAGVEKRDTKKDINYVANKILNLRIFPDKERQMNLSVLDINGEILSVSQFTLTSRLKKGRRPDFSRAMKPDKAKKFYEEFINKLKSSTLKVEDGIFGEIMDIEIINEGPVTFIIDSKVKNFT